MKTLTRKSIARILTGSVLAFACAISFSLTPAMAAPGDAPDPETAAAVKKLMQTMKIKESMEPALKGMKDMQNAMIDQQQLSDEQKAAAREIMAASMSEVEKLMSWESLSDLMVRVYAKIYTTEEINGMIKLFESPAGQAYVNKLPQLQTATMKEMQKLMMDLMPKIQAKTQEAVERVKAKEQQNK